MPVPSYTPYSLTDYPDGFKLGYPVTNRYRSGHKLKPMVAAYKRPQPYFMRVYSYTWQEGVSCAPGVEAPIWANQIKTDEGNQCLIKAWDKLRSKALARAETGVGLVEIQKSIEMVNYRCVQLARAAMALKRGQFRKFTAILGTPPHPADKHRKKVFEKEISGLWLEYWMGWAPTVGDIFAALEVCTSTPPIETVKASSGFAKTYKGQTQAGDEIRKWDMEATIRVGLKVDLEMVNPNLALLNQLGLANPATVFYQTLPFSFMLEWFVNLGQLLNMYSDFLGFNLKDPETTWKYGATGLSTYTHRVWGNQSPIHRIGVDKAQTFSRALTLEKPSLGFRRVNGLSVTRGATAIALLISIFIKP